MALWVTFLSLTHEDASSIPSTYIKRQPCPEIEEKFLLPKTLHTLYTKPREPEMDLT